MFLQPERTQYDLVFHIFGIPVRVNPMFWVMAFIIGWGGMRHGFQFLLVWVACVFVSILVHELGHVLTGQAFGSFGHIVLYAFGGLAIGSHDVPQRWQRIAVLFAGPLAGFMLLSMIVGSLYFLDTQRYYAAIGIMKMFVGLPMAREEALDALPLLIQPSLADAALQALIWINLMWGILNLLPIWPLDGGQICREVCGWFVPGRNLRISLGISTLVAGILALHCLMADFGRPLLPFVSIGSRLNAMLFGLLAVQSYMLMQQVQRTYRPWDDWGERDPNIWR